MTSAEICPIYRYVSEMARSTTRFNNRSDLLFLICVALAVSLSSGCSSRSDRLAKITPGQTTVAELHELRGAPASTEAVRAVPGCQLDQYPSSGETFQHCADRVVARMRDPEAHERTLQYWRHLWRGKRQTEAPVTPGASAHANEGTILRNEDDGISVMYRRGSGEVFRVVEY